MRRSLTLLAAVVVTGVVVLAGWTVTAPPGAGPLPDPSASPSEAPEPSRAAPGSPTGSPTVEPTAADPPPVPRVGSCYRMSFDEAVAPTASRGSVPCERDHTSTTYAVGVMDTVVGGHLVAVDSERVRAQVASSCPESFTEHVGGTLEQQRLSQLRPVWFTPSIEQSDAGADWFRCDAIALARDRTLAPLDASVEGALDTDAGRARYGLCATAEPGRPDSRRVICSSTHSWRAIRTVTFSAGGFPGQDAVRSAGEQPCRAAGREASEDQLDFQWGYEWPTADQWRSGQTYGICWVPDPAT